MNEKQIKYVKKTMREVQKAILAKDFATADMMFQLMLFLVSKEPMQK